MNRMVYIAFYKVVYEHPSGKMDSSVVNSLSPTKDILYLAFV